MKNYSEMYYDERSIIMMQWYEGCFSYMMRNLADYVSDIYDVEQVEAVLEGQVETEVERTLKTSRDEEDYGDFEIDDADLFKKDMLDYLMGVYEEMYLY